jgi:hypothetical protein
MTSGVAKSPAPMRVWLDLARAGNLLSHKQPSARSAQGLAN